MKKKWIVVCLVTLSTIIPATGCSSRRTETSTVESSGPDETGRTSYRHEETKSVEKESSNECSGVLSCTVDVLGNIIALPFRAVGALVDGIF